MSIVRMWQTSPMLKPQIAIEVSIRYTS